MKRITSRLLLSVIAIITVTGLTSCGAWYGSTTVGPDLYVGDYPGNYYNPGYYNGVYYPGGYYNPGYLPATPPPPPPPAPNRPVILPGNAPAGNPGGLNGPSSRPNQGNNNSGVGSPSEGGYRGQGGGGQNSRH